MNDPSNIGNWCDPNPSLTSADSQGPTVVNTGNTFPMVTNTQGYIGTNHQCLVCRVTYQINYGNILTSTGTGNYWNPPAEQSLLSPHLCDRCLASLQKVVKRQQEVERL